MSVSKRRCNMTLTVRETADVLCVTPARVRELIADGRLKAKNHPTAYRWMISASDLTAYVKKGKTSRGRPRAIDMEESAR